MRYGGHRVRSVMMRGLASAAWAQDTKAAAGEKVCAGKGNQKATRKPMRVYDLPKDQPDALVAYLQTLKK